jgi:hypothetical protein
MSTVMVKPVRSRETALVSLRNMSEVRSRISLEKKMNTTTVKPVPAKKFYFKQKPGDPDQPQVRTTMYEVFTDKFKSITKTLPFNIEWSDGKGGILSDHPEVASLKPGESLSSMTPGKRRIIFLGTRYGTISVYDRFTMNDNRNREPVFYINRPEQMDKLGFFPHPYLNEQQMRVAVDIHEHVEKRLTEMSSLNVIPFNK